MEKKIMKIFAAVLGGITVLTMVLLGGISDIHSKSEVLAKNISSAKSSANDKNKNKAIDIMSAAVLDDKSTGFEGKGQLRIALPEEIDEDSPQFSEDVMKRRYRITIPGVSRDYFDNNPIAGSVNNIDDFDAYETGDTAYYDITMNGIYVMTPTVEDDYLYIDFRDPHSVYDNIVVIDAGHGGRDVGADDTGVYEKSINLSIVQRLKELIDVDSSIHAYYTRLDDTNVSLEERVNLANDARADAFLSVHNNSLSGIGKNTTDGSQVLYYASDPTGSSKRFADICLDNLCTGLGNTNRGLVNGDDIYIIHNSKVPVALVEIGFLSNPKDLKNLTDDNYQRMCANVLYDSIKEMLSSK